MKKSYFILMVFVLIIAGLGLTSSSSVGLARTPDESDSDSNTVQVFMPVVNLTRTYDIYGKVSGPEGQPVGGVSIIDQDGRQTLSNADGNLQPERIGSWQVFTGCTEGWPVVQTRLQPRLRCFRVIQPSI